MTADAPSEQSAEQADTPARAAAATRSAGSLSATALRGLFAASSAWLDRNAGAIDAINVYPVPDGDTGSNMAGTLRDTLATVGSGLHAAGDVSAALARGALRAARGNSGVILSQILKGFAEATAGAERVDGPALAAALSRGSRAAYAALREPVEGTILTVVRAAAEAAEAIRSAEPLPVLEAALQGARKALARTPDLLPVLKQAGVVDSGGLGLVVLLEGAVQFLRGEASPAEIHAPDAIREDWLAQTAATHAQPGAAFGYCTEFVLTAARLDLDGLRGRLEALGDSVIVVGDASAARVHLHAQDPGAALSLAGALGPLIRIKIDNMQAQSEGVVTAARETASTSAAPLASAPPAAVAIVAVVAGAGLTEVLRSLGAAQIVPGGATMNPSVEQLRAAIEAAPAPAVIVLPNHRHIVLAAEQAARLSDKQVEALPTSSIVQGISALLAFRDDLGLAENAAAMRRAAAAAHTVEVTRASRATTVAGLPEPVAAGQAIALIDGRLEVAAGTLEDALLTAVARLAPGEDAVATLYFGEGVDEATAAGAAARIRTGFPQLALQSVAGGQPHYPYILGLE